MQKSGHIGLICAIDCGIQEIDSNKNTTKYKSTRDLPGECSGSNYVYSIGKALTKKTRRKNLPL